MFGTKLTRKYWLSWLLSLWFQNSARCESQRIQKQKKEKCPRRQLLGLPEWHRFQPDLSNNTDYLPLAYKPATEIRGDTNSNGIRDTGDATLILRYIVDLSIPPESLPILPTGDMNCNCIIDTGDATLIFRDVVGLDIPRCWE